ncbi:formate transporter FocA [Lelliottia aquatilis]|uniref:Formate transporter FocA n=1 Tax=Lelliottia aquatilis TaxID=2080838 RepID=A0ABX5A722_9ENTR|nr:formate transporter FocA [Lelliottia aquatilis]POZ28263.1 formate transporter FocA [Lelliottia sp. 7254-16]POZ25087.1 formate transporter FocA [Lelliottia aquatilis]POZ30060.1 formate transporter FocA [Lelliottia aquatilis]POZ35624.1 formate transporter FocA [Lelliottia aquatilis]
MLQNHALCGPISQARYDLYQFLFYNALLVSRRRLNKERVSVKADNPFDLILPAAMAKVAEEAGVYKATKHPMTTFYLAITAGVFISIAFVFYITATTGTAAMPFGIAKLIGGICFSLGLILCVICGADLFTSTVLIVVAKASGRITWGQLARNWINVYVGNLIGCLLFVLLMWLSGEYMTANGGWGLNVLQTADHKMHHTFIEAVALGILANLMVCLAVWMSYSGRSLMDKAMIMVLPVAMFVASGFEHSIANMFMIPMGIVIRNFASPEFWTAVGSTPESFSHLTIMNFITDNLIPVTIGNIIGGGLLVGLTYWVIYLRGDNHH